MATRLNYSDSKYGEEHIFILPNAIEIASAISISVPVVFSEDIIINKVGFCVETAVATVDTVGQIAIKPAYGGNSSPIISMAIADNSTANSVVSSAVANVAVTSGNAIVFYHLIQGAEAAGCHGNGHMFIGYKVNY